MRAGLSCIAAARLGLGMVAKMRGTIPDFEILESVRERLMAGAKARDNSNDLRTLKPCPPETATIANSGERSRTSSQIAQPSPIAMASAEFHKPSTRQIEDCHH